MQLIGSRRVSTGAFLALALSCLFHAATAVADGADDPVVMLQEMTDRVISSLREHPELLRDQQKVRVLAEELILPNVDFRTASRWVLGKHWRQASGEQRDAFVSEFRELLLGTYVSSLDKYRENRLEFIARRPGQPDNRAVVDAQVIQQGGSPIGVTFRLHRPASAWLVYDIVIEGVSLVATHRSGFASEIRSNGIDGLIARLVTLNARESTAAGMTN